MKKILLFLLLLTVGASYVNAENWDAAASFYSTCGGDLSYGWTSVNSYTSGSATSSYLSLSSYSSERVPTLVIFSRNKKIKKIKLTCNSGMTSDIINNFLPNSGTTSYDESYRELVWTSSTEDGDDYVAFTNSGSKIVQITKLQIQFSDEVIDSKKTSLNGDVDNNGTVDVADVSALISKILN